MYRIATTTTQNREPQLPHASRNTNPHVSKSSGVNHTTSVSRPQLKFYQVKDKVVPNNSQVKFKKKEVEDHHRISSISKKTKFLTACNDSSKSSTLNVNAICVECGKYVFNSNHDACVSRYLKDVNANYRRQSSALNNIKFLRPIWSNVPLSFNLFRLSTHPISLLTSVCTKHMTLQSYRDLNQGNVTIKRVYYVECLNHNLFLVGQFCDADLEVAFRKSTCFVRDLQGNDLLTGNRGSDLYTISLQETTSSTPICFMAKASPTQAWLWHRRLSHLNFDYITLLSKKDIVIGLPNPRKAELASHGLDETPEVLKDFLTMIQRNLQAQVITVRTDRGTEFLNKTLHAYFKEEGIEHQTSLHEPYLTKRPLLKDEPLHLVEAARTMLSASKLPLSF
ncbi:retrovirus-related pol polyprotein from transposon TNT 1-94 [Tanacetum coccineum]